MTDLLQWWIYNLTDNEQGGFYGHIDGFGKLHPQANKGVILNTRLLGAFSAAAIHTGSATYESIANRAYQYLLNHFWVSRSKVTAMFTARIGNHWPISV